jgi:NTE family protein
VNLPHSGYLALFAYKGNRTGLGATDSYDHIVTAFIAVQTVGRLTGLIKGEGGTGLQSNVPFYDQFSLGGLFRLSGRPTGQLIGNNYGLGSFLLYYRLSDTAGLVIKNLSVGVSAEVGNTWLYRQPVTWSGMKSGGSVYLVADTLLGPLFFGYGRSGSHNSSAYLFLNRSF